MALTSAVLFGVFVTLILAPTPSSAGETSPPTTRDGSDGNGRVNLDRVKMNFLVRAQFAGDCSGALLSNRKLYCLTKSGLLVYNLSEKNAALVQTANLLSVGSPRDVVQSASGQEMYVADYSSKTVLTYNVPTSKAKKIDVPLKNVRCQLSCHPTSLSVDPFTGNLLVVCSDDKQVATCSSSGQVQTLPLPKSASRLIHATWLMGRQFASLIQTQSGAYTICISNLDGSGSCPYTVQQKTPSFLIPTPDNTVTLVDQASNNALFAYAPGAETGFKIPLNANLQAPISLVVDYKSSQMVIISSQQVTVFDVQVTIS